METVNTEKRELTVKDSSIAFVTSFLLGQVMLVLFAVICMVIIKFSGSSSSFSEFSATDVGYLISAIVLNFGFLIIYFILRHNKAEKFASKVKPLKLLMYICIAVLCYFTLYPVVVSFNQLFHIKGSSLNISGIGYVYAAFSRVLIPAICEELIFRGIMFKGLANKNKQLAILVSAVMFSIFHMSKEQLLYPLLMGLLFGVIMAYENNIIYCIIVHVINNSLALAGLGYYFSHWTYYLLAVVLFAAFVGILMWLTFKGTQKFKLEKDELIYLLVSLGIMIVFWVLMNFVAVA